jgi:hypothetical protein
MTEPARGFARQRQMCRWGLRLSVNYWWIGFFVDEAMHARIKPHFDAATAKSALSAEAQQAIASWCERPSGYEETAPGPTREKAERTNAFLSAFNPSGFVALARQLLAHDGALADLLAEQKLFRMASTARHPPVSMVWHALGFERAKGLPGQMGNMLLSPAEVEPALEATRRAFEGPPADHLLAVARRYCGLSVNDESLREALTFQPDGLAAAFEWNEGFFALTCPRI